MRFYVSVLCSFFFFVCKVYGDGSSTGLYCFCSSHHHPAPNAIGQTRDTQIDHFQGGEELVFEVQVVWRGFSAVVFDKGEAAGPQDVVVGSSDRPVEVGQAELVIVDGAVGDAVGGPGRETALLQVAAQHLRGSGADTTTGKGPRK